MLYCGIYESISGMLRAANSFRFYISKRTGHNNSFVTSRTFKRYRSGMLRVWYAYYLETFNIRKKKLWTLRK